MRVVQAFTREKQNEAKFREINVWYRAANQRTIVLNGIYFPVVDFFSSLATAIVIGYGSYRVFGGATSVGTMTAFVLYLSNFFDPVQQLSQLYNTFLSAVAALDRITELLDEQPEIVDHLARRSRRNDGRARRAHRSGQVDDREADRPILRAAERADHNRRQRHQPRDPAVAAQPARGRAARRVPLCRQRARQHRLRET